jgi:hypothetical protein
LLFDTIADSGVETGGGNRGIGRAETREKSGHLSHQFDLLPALRTLLQMSFDANEGFAIGGSCQEIFEPILNYVVHIHFFP